MTGGARHARGQNDEPAPALEGPQLDGEELTRGPVHEAFAQPVVFNPEPGPVIAKQPPDDIEEIPPTEKPEGDEVNWISGYWAWDEEDDRFLWVSGLWRSEPPGLQWVPGYWAKVDDGFQWVSGFWQAEESQETEYLPPPPESLENGPPAQVATAEQTYVPGSWLWVDSRYAWRPGYYVTCRPGWIWVPARYVWTPLGYVFVDGYWDYSVRRRGVLYAPLRLPVGYVMPARVWYTPRVVIDTDVFTNHFFCRPTVGFYYFGDYYAASYLNRGFYPRHAFHMSSSGYDPIFAYHTWFYSKNDPGWRDRVRADYRHCRDHIDARPPITMAATRELVATGGAGVHNRLLATASLTELAGRPTSQFKAVKIDNVQRDRYKKQAQTMHQAEHKRRDQELQAVSLVATKDREKPVEVGKDGEPDRDRERDRDRDREKHGKPTKLPTVVAKEGRPTHRAVTANELPPKPTLPTTAPSTATTGRPAGGNRNKLPSLKDVEPPVGKDSNTGNAAQRDDRPGDRNNNRTNNRTNNRPDNRNDNRADNRGDDNRDDKPNDNRKGGGKPDAKDVEPGGGPEVNRGKPKVIRGKQPPTQQRTYSGAEKQNSNPPNRSFVEPKQPQPRRNIEPRNNEPRNADPKPNTQPRNADPKPNVQPRNAEPRPGAGAAKGRDDNRNHEKGTPRNEPKGRNKKDGGGN